MHVSEVLQHPEEGATGATVDKTETDQEPATSQRFTATAIGCEVWRSPKSRSAVTVTVKSLRCGGNTTVNNQSIGADANPNTRGWHRASASILARLRLFPSSPARGRQLAFCCICLALRPSLPSFNHRTSTIHRLTSVRTQYTRSDLLWTRSLRRKIQGSARSLYHCPRRSFTLTRPDALNSTRPSWMYSGVRVEPVGGDSYSAALRPLCAGLKWTFPSGKRRSQILSSYPQSGRAASLPLSPPLTGTYRTPPYCIVPATMALVSRYVHIRTRSESPSPSPCVSTLPAPCQIATQRDAPCSGMGDI